MTPISFKEYPKEPVVVENLSEKMMREAKFVPLEMGKSFLRIAMADPEDFYTTDALRLASGLNIDVCQGKEDDILDAIEKLGAESRQVLVMRTIQKAPYEEISDQVGKSVHHIRSIYHRARKQLKDILVKPNSQQSKMGGI